MGEYDFSEYEKKQDDKMPETAQVPQEKKEKQVINFQELPKNTDEILNVNHKEIDYSKEEAVPIPTEQPTHVSYLNLVLSPNLRDLELMIRGLEYVKRYNKLINKEEIILRRIESHPLNEYGINSVMAELKVYCSPEIKLGRKKEKDYYSSVRHVCHSIIRLIYKNLKNFGMDTQIKQRKAKTLCNAIVEFIDASYSRSIQGKENDLSRATEFKVESNIDGLNDPAKLFSREQKEGLKN